MFCQYRTRWKILMKGIWPVLLAFHSSNYRCCYWYCNVLASPCLHFLSKNHHIILNLNLRLANKVRKLADFLRLESSFFVTDANGCSRASDRTIHIRIPIFLQLWHVSTQSYEATSTYLAYSQEEETHIVLLVKLPVYQSSQYWYNFAILLCRLWKSFA